MYTYTHLFIYLLIYSAPADADPGAQPQRVPHVGLRAWGYVCIYIYIYTHTHIYWGGRRGLRKLETDACNHYIYILCVHECMYVYMSTCIHVYVYIYIYIYICISLLQRYRCVDGRDGLLFVQPECVFEMRVSKRAGRRG